MCCQELPQLTFCNDHSTWHGMHATQLGRDNKNMQSVNELKHEECGRRCHSRSGGIEAHLSSPTVNVISKAPSAQTRTWDRRPTSGRHMSAGTCRARMHAGRSTIYRQFYESLFKIIECETTSRFNQVACASSPWAFPSEFNLASLLEVTKLSNSRIRVFSWLSRCIY